MTSQMNFSKFITAFGNYRSLFLYRPTITKSQAATLKTESKEKIKNLPEKPKKPATSFFLFVKEHRDELKENHPNLKTSEIAKQLSERWNNLDDSLKTKYVEQYKDSMQSYLQKYLEYNSKLTEEQKHIIKEIEEEKSKERENRKLKKTLKQLKKPKRPVGAFVYFALEYFEKEKSTGIKFADFLKKSRPIWESLSESEKQKFNAMYLDDKKRYELEMEQWEAKMMKTGHTNLIRRNTAAQHAIPIRTIKRSDSENSSFKSGTSTGHSNK